MDNKVTSIKVNTKIRDLANKLKRKYKYKSYVELLEDCLMYFDEKELDPKDAKKPIHELVTETRNTLVSFQKTFESKKLMPILFELKQQYLSTNLTMQDFINYSTKYNNHLLDVLENFDQNKENNRPVFRDKIEDNIEGITNENKINSIDNNLEELKVLFAEFDKSKTAKFSEGQNMYQYDVMSYNLYMDKIRLILNRK